jgi:hypothetical protein
LGGEQVALGLRGLRRGSQASYVSQSSSDPAAGRGLRQKIMCVTCHTWVFP